MLTNRTRQKRPLYKTRKEMKKVIFNVKPSNRMRDGFTRSFIAHLKTPKSTGTKAHKS